MRVLKTGTTMTGTAKRLLRGNRSALDSRGTGVRDVGEYPVDVFIGEVNGRRYLVAYVPPKVRRVLGVNHYLYLAHDVAEAEESVRWSNFDQLQPHRDIIAHHRLDMRS